MRPRWPYFLAAGLVLACGFLVTAVVFGPVLLRFFSRSVAPAPDFEATLQAMIAAGNQSPTTLASGSAVPSAAFTPIDQGEGHIVFTCQLYKYQSAEQICIMNPDGSGYRDLTQDPGTRHYYPSLAPDGKSVVYSQYREDNIYEIYELQIQDGTAHRLTDRLGVLTGPEISPDGRTIAFMRWTPASDQYQLWLMNRDGSNARRLSDASGWDPTWSPDGSQILFASDLSGTVQLHVVNLDGKELRRISDLPAIRGRSDWSTNGLITTYSGESWKREVFVLEADGSDIHRVSPPGGNSQGPTFSPDGQRIAFTAYYDRFNDIHGCEIYAMRVDGSDLRRLTDNDYCDYQPRWGP